MFKTFKEAVDRLVKEGKSEDTAYAICISNYMKEINKSPFVSILEIQTATELSEKLKKLLESIYLQNIKTQIFCLEGFINNRKVKILEREVTGSIQYVKNS